jgi:glycerol uptake facilitator-like aquaporin
VELFLYIVAQIGGGILGAFVAHGMFEVDIEMFNGKARTTNGEFFAEIVI